MPFKVIFLVYLLAAALLGQAQQAHALDPDLQYYQYEFGFPGPDSGVPDAVYDVVEDSSGFLWLATVRGLMRFDGVRTDLFRVSSYPGVLSNKPHTLHIDRQQRMFIISDEGVSIYADEQFQSVVDEFGSNIVVNAIAEDASGTIWLGGDNGVWQYFEDYVATLMPQSVQSVRSMQSHGDRIYMGSRGRVFGASDGTVTEIDLPPGYQNSWITDLELFQGKVWGATAAGLFVIIDGVAQPVNRPEVAGKSVEVLGADSDQNLWFAGDEAIGRFLPDGRIETPDDGSSVTDYNPQYTGWFEDSQGVLWVSSRVYGISSRRNTPVLRTSFTEGLPSPEVSAVAASADGRIFIATERGVVVLNDDGPQLLMEEGSVRNDRIITMVSKFRDELWLGSHGKVQKLKEVDDRWEQVATWETAGARVQDIAIDPDGDVWVGTDSGLHRLSDAGLSPVLDVTGTPVTSLHIDTQGALWVGTTSGLGRYANNSIEWQAAESVGRKTSILSIAESSSGKIIAATSANGFLVQTTNGWRKIGETDGIPQENIVAISVEKDQLWVATRAGLFKTNANELSENIDQAVSLEPVIAAPRYRSAFAEMCCNGESDAAIAMRPSSIAVTTINGIIVFPTDIAITRAGLPKPYIRRVRLQDESFESGDWDGIELPSDSRSITFEYSAIALMQGDQVRFRYRLLGLSDEWIEGDTASVATFNALPAGDYTFELQASIYPDRWSTADASVMFSTAANFYETVWFKGLVWLASLLLAVIVIAWRMRSMRRYHYRLENSIQQRTSELKEVNDALQEANLGLKKASQTDPLTGLVNRRYFEHDNIGDRIINRVGDSGVIIMMDIDHFKRVNDSHGHLAGDMVLEQFADLLRSVTRESDLLARWGGEEFLLVCQTENNEPMTLLSRLNSAVREFPFVLPDGRKIKITSSIGAISYPLWPSDNLNDRLVTLTDLADNALYCVKVNGRDGWAMIEGSGMPIKNLTHIHGNSGLKSLLDSKALFWQSSRIEIQATMEDTITRLKAIG